MGTKRDTTGELGEGRRKKYGNAEKKGEGHREAEKKGTDTGKKMGVQKKNRDRLMQAGEKGKRL